MPFWDRTGWKPIQEYYGGGAKQGLKRCIEALVETPYEELDTLDHLSLREWMRRYTSDEGVFLVWEAISVLEQITERWYDHSASENLYVRKLHYSLKRTAGYSFYPIGGWVQLWDAMADAYRALGGELLQPASVTARARRERGAVTGLELSDGEVIEAPEVVVSAPVWNLPRLFDDGVLPWDLLQRIELLRKNRNRACWLGYWIAAKEPVIAMTEREMASFFATPRTGPARLHAQLHRLRPVRLAAGRVPHVRRRRLRRGRALRRPRLDRAQVPRALARHRGDAPAGEARPLEEAPPRHDLRRDQQARPRRRRAARRARARRGRPLAGGRHDALPAGVGIDKAARTGITAAEAVLGGRLPFFADTVRY